MKTFNHFLSILMIAALTNPLCNNARAAAPTIDTFNIQSFLKLSNNSAVSATSADFVFGVFKGTTCIWAKRYSAVAINNGVLNQKISGSGTSISSITNPAATPGECVANFSGTTLNSTLLNTGSPAALSIRVYAETSIDSYKPIWDIPLNSAPTAFIADLANSATNAITATTANGLAPAIVATVGGMSSANKFPQLDATGLLDASFIPNIPSSSITGLGTASTYPVGSSANNVPVLNGSGQLLASEMPTYGSNLNSVLATNGTGVITPIAFTASGTANSIPILDAAGQIPASMLSANKITSGTLGAAYGGTGVNSITLNGLMVGAGTGPVTTIGPGPNLNILVSNGTSWSSGSPGSFGMVDITTTQSIGGAKTFTGTPFTVNGATTSLASANTNVTGASTFTGLSTFNGGISNSSTSTLTGAVTMGNSLGVTGLSTLTGGLTVGANPTSLGGTLAVTGAATHSGTSTLTGATTVGSTLGVTGLSTLTGGLTVGANPTSLGGTLAVSGAATHLGTSTLTGAVTMGSTLGVTGLSTLTGGLTVGANPTSLGSTLSVTGATTAAAATFSGAVTHSSTSTLTGAVTMGSTLGVTGLSTLTGGLTVGANPTSLGSTLAVTGASTMTGAINANGGIKVGSSGTTLTQVIKCATTSSAMSTSTFSAACTGVTTAATVACSPATAPTGLSSANHWVTMFYPTAGNINVSVVQVGAPSAWTTVWNCTATQ